MEDRRVRLAGVALGVGAVLVALPMAVATLALGGVPRSAGEPSAGGGFGVSTFARSDIPPSYLALYLRAASRYGLDWSILAGIGKVECDHGRDPAPSCTREGAVNSAGAGGPAQFLASTWRQYGVDGDGDGVIDRWDPADAIFGMANYLRASGAPADYGRAIYAYNHAGWYVAEVEHWASRYRGPVEGAAGVGEAGGGGAGAGETGETRGALSEGGASTGSPTPMIFIPGEHARLSPTDGHLALVPSE
ncbi:MAG TPA: lytic transglycosylase domain-containing protein, partial [Solirubrobacteraceae bacterium]|nr:lytic transglycosylase domain-containing protein [Solirubrobacteraceae bacterium]